jgi:hypothetical protein
MQADLNLQKLHMNFKFVSIEGVKGLIPESSMNVIITDKAPCWTMSYQAHQMAQREGTKPWILPQLLVFPNGPSHQQSARNLTSQQQCQSVIDRNIYTRST